jgi:hypothetical protein
LADVLKVASCATGYKVRLTGFSQIKPAALRHLRPQMTSTADGRNEFLVPASGLAAAAVGDLVPSHARSGPQSSSAAFLLKDGKQW